MCCAITDRQGGNSDDRVAESNNDSRSVSPKPYNINLAIHFQLLPLGCHLTKIPGSGISPAWPNCRIDHDRVSMPSGQLQKLSLN